jgi:hypothetical protein
MIPARVWGCAGPKYLCSTARGWMVVRSKRSRIAVSLMSVAGLLALAGLIAPTAIGAPRLELRFAAQPQDSVVNTTIRAADLDQTASFVQVKLVDPSTGATVTTSKSSVTFSLATGPGLASGSLSVKPQPLIDGVATFGTGTLSIGTLNEPQFTSYRLIPATTKGAFITGPASDPFDIWEGGDTCSGGTDTCQTSLRGGEDQYTLSAAGTLGASELSSSLLPGLTCAGQAVIFANSVFSHATTEPGTSLAPVFLSNHITAADWKASANNGQAHADWCVGLKTADPWLANGGTFTEQDVNGDAPGGVLFVGLAPRCPSKNAQNFAPCIVSRTGDGADGSITTGWLPGGDPPRRT